MNQRQRVGVLGRGRVSDGVRRALVRSDWAEPVARPPFAGLVALSGAAGDHALVRGLVTSGLPAVIAPAAARKMPAGDRALVLRSAAWLPGVAALRRHIAGAGAPLSVWLRLPVPGGIPTSEAGLGGQLEVALTLALAILGADGPPRLGTVRARRVGGDTSGGGERLRVGLSVGRERFAEIELVAAPSAAAGAPPLRGARIDVDCPLGTFSWRHHGTQERVRLERRTPDPETGFNVARGEYRGDPMSVALDTLGELTRGAGAGARVPLWGIGHERVLRAAVARVFEQLAESRVWPTDVGGMLLVKLPRLRRYGDQLRVPSLGLARVAAALAEDGVPVRVADLDAACWQDGFSVEALGDPDAVERALAAGDTSDLPSDLPAHLKTLLDELTGRLPLAWPTAVGFSVVDREGAAHLAVARLMARRIKARRPDLLVVLGGVTDELRAGETLRDPAVDVVVEEDGEHAARRLLEARALGVGNLSNAPNIALLRGVAGAEPEVWRTPRRTIRLCDRPTPDFSGFPLANYRRGISEGLRAALERAGEPVPDGDVGAYLPYNFVLGCLGKCTFCGFGDRVDLLDEDRVVEDLAALVDRHGVRDFVFWNTTVNLAPRRLERLCDALIAADLDLRWTDSARPHRMTPQLARKVRAAGCVMLSFGVESGSDEVLARMQKGFRRAEIEETIAAVHGAGILTRVNLIAGYLHERDADVDETVGLVKARQNDIDLIGCFNGFQLLETAGFDDAQHGIRLLGFSDTIDPDQTTLAYDEVGGLSWPEKKEQIARSRARVLDAIRAGGIYYGAVVDEFDLFWLSRRYDDPELVRRFALRPDMEELTLAQRGRETAVD